MIFYEKYIFKRPGFPAHHRDRLLFLLLSRLLVDINKSPPFTNHFNLYRDHCFNHQTFPPQLQRSAEQKAKVEQPTVNQTITYQHSESGHVVGTSSTRRKPPSGLDLGQCYQVRYATEEFQLEFADPPVVDVTGTRWRTTSERRVTSPEVSVVMVNTTHFTVRFYAYCHVCDVSDLKLDWRVEGVTSHDPCSWRSRSSEDRTFREPDWCKRNRTNISLAYTERNTTLK